MSNSCNLQICYVTRQGGIKVANRTKVANGVTLKQRDYPGLSCEPNVIIKVLSSGRGQQKSESEEAVTPEGRHREMQLHWLSK